MINVGLKDFPAPTQKAVLLWDLRLERRWYGGAGCLLEERKQNGHYPKADFSDRVCCISFTLTDSVQDSCVWDTVFQGYLVHAVCPTLHLAPCITVKGCRWALSINAEREERPSILRGFVCLDNKWTCVPRVIFPTCGKEEESRWLTVT